MPQVPLAKEAPRTRREPRYSGWLTKVPCSPDRHRTLACRRRYVRAPGSIVGGRQQPVPAGPPREGLECTLTCPPPPRGRRGGAVSAYPAAQHSQGICCQLRGGHRSVLRCSWESIQASRRRSPDAANLGLPGADGSRTDNCGTLLCRHRRPALGCLPVCAVRLNWRRSRHQH